MKRFGCANWNGGLREGKGSVSTESRALETYPYTFFSRYGEKPGTNPEELLGAAHSACFTMSFVRLLGMAKFLPEQVHSKSEVVIDKDGDGFSPRFNREDTGHRPSHVPVDRRKSKDRLSCLQIDEGRDWLRGHSPLVDARRRGAGCTGCTALLLFAGSVLIADRWRDRFEPLLLR
jgi:organic hydroperoxide reductase OsmC/OhrA